MCKMEVITSPGCLHLNLLQWVHLVAQTKAFLQSTHRSYYWVHLKKKKKFQSSPIHSSAIALLWPIIFSWLNYFNSFLSSPVIWSFLTSSSSRCPPDNFPKKRIFISCRMPLNVSLILSSHCISPDSSSKYKSIHFCANLAFCPFIIAPYHALVSFLRVSCSTKLSWFVFVVPLIHAFPTMSVSFISRWIWISLQVLGPSLCNCIFLYGSTSCTHEIICVISSMGTWTSLHQK